jgi:hypothetical protein
LRRVVLTTICGNLRAARSDCAVLRTAGRIIEVLYNTRHVCPPQRGQRIGPPPCSCSRRRRTRPLLRRSVDGCRIIPLCLVPTQST